MAKQHEHLAKEWERLKKVLASPDAGEEEFDQVVESVRIHADQVSPPVRNNGSALRINHG